MAPRPQQAFLPTGQAWPLAGMGSSVSAQAPGWTLDVELPGTTPSHRDAIIGIVVAGVAVAALVWAMRSR